MSEATRVFLGLVTHKGSRFNSNGQATEQVMRLASALEMVGIESTVLISDRDDFDSVANRITLSHRWNSAWHQAKVERDWSRYLDGSDTGRRQSLRSRWFYFFAMFFKRAIDLSMNPHKLVRLANIDLSHLRILQDGIRDGADWVLVIEDDALIGDVTDLGSKLDFLTGALNLSRSEVFINLSESIGIDDLKIARVVSSAIVLHTFPDGSQVLRLTPSVSNTVCANLYSRDFAHKFAQWIAESGLLPSVPIDWRLNQVLMKLPPDELDALWVSPGPIIQGSMHSTVIQN